MSPAPGAVTWTLGMPETDAATIMITERGESPGGQYQRNKHRRAHRLFFACLAASAVLHAAVLTISPGVSLDRETPKVTVLEITFLRTAMPHASPVEKARSRPDRPQTPARSVRPAPSQRVPSREAVPEPSDPRLEAIAPAVVPDPAANQASPGASGTEAAGAAAPAPARTGASYSRNPAPTYPLAARRAGEQGMVTLRVLVTREGAPGRVEVEKSSGSIHLDAAALEAVKAWRFAPARRGAAPVESWHLVPIVFRLEAGTSQKGSSN